MCPKWWTVDGDGLPDIRVSFDVPKDVAISGSTPTAEEGTLILLAGGNPNIFSTVEPILQAIAARYFHLSPSGSGTTMKLVVNSLLGVGMQAIAEACAFGQKAGLDRDLLPHVLSQTAVVAPAHAGKLLRAVRNDYSPQFPLRLMNKDLRLILETGASIDAAMPATQPLFKSALKHYLLELKKICPR
jgi:3-hydroxyisobutyrate dehydrogenase